MTAASEGRDAVVVRRGLRAGGLVGAAVGLLLLVRVVVIGAGGQAGALALVVGLVFGTATSAAWLLLAGILDLVADHRPSRRRIAWTLGAAAAASLSPVLLLAAQASP